MRPPLGEVGRGPCWSHGLGGYDLLETKHWRLLSLCFARRNLKCARVTHLLCVWEYEWRERFG